MKKNLRNKRLKILDKKFGVNIYDMILIINDHPSFYHIIETKLKENNSNKKIYFRYLEKTEWKLYKKSELQYLKI